MDKVLTVLGAGQLIIYLVQQLPAVKQMKIKFFHDLFNCSLCLGVYVYFSLCCFYRLTIGPYVPLVSEAVTGALFSYISFIFFLGLKLKYGSFDIE